MYELLCLATEAEQWAWVKLCRTRSGYRYTPSVYLFTAVNAWCYTDWQTEFSIQERCGCLLDAVPWMREAMLLAEAPDDVLHDALEELCCTSPTGGYDAIRDTLRKVRKISEERDLR